MTLSRNLKQIQRADSRIKWRTVHFTTSAKHIIMVFCKKHPVVTAMDWSHNGHITAKQRQRQMPTKSLPCRATRTSSLFITSLEK